MKENYTDTAPIPKIEIGYVLDCLDNDGDRYFMMVIPNDEGDLACSSEKHWWHLSCFDENLIYRDTKIMKIYGRTSNRYAWKIGTEGRKLLWEREEPKFKVGDIVEIVGSSYSHDLLIGSRAIVKEVCDDGSLEVIGTNGKRLISQTIALDSAEKVV